MHCPKCCFDAKLPQTHQTQPNPWRQAKRAGWDQGFVWEASYCGGNPGSTRRKVKRDLFNTTPNGPYWHIFAMSKENGYPRPRNKLNFNKSLASTQFSKLARRHLDQAQPMFFFVSKHGSRQTNASNVANKHYFQQNGWERSLFSVTWCLAR